MLHKICPSVDRQKVIVKALMTLVDGEEDVHLYYYHQTLHLVEICYVIATWMYYVFLYSGDGCSILGFEVVSAPDYVKLVQETTAKNL